VGVTGKECKRNAIVINNIMADCIKEEEEEECIIFLRQTLL